VATLYVARNPITAGAGRYSILSGSKMGFCSSTLTSELSWAARKFLSPSYPAGDPISKNISRAT